MSDVVAWVCVTLMVCAMAACTYGISINGQNHDHDMRERCWESGGNWERGWNGYWCKPLPTPPHTGKE